MVVSIGPYHRMDKRLKSMEHFKLQFLETFLGLSTGDEWDDSPTSDEGESVPSLSIRIEEDFIPDLWRGDEEESYDDSEMELEQDSHLLLMSCVEKILEKEDEIRGSYADPISLSRDDFVQMVLLDSVFIIWSLRRLSMFSPSVDDIASLKKRVVKSAFERVKLAQEEIIRDLLLLENQLPLFIIREIYNIRYPAAIQGTTTSDALVAEFFNIELPPDWVSLGNLLALMRISYINSFPRYQGEKLEKICDRMSPTASVLHAAGVKFEPGFHDNNNGLLNIKFDKHTGVLTIPKLNCDDQSQSVFRNVIALEHSMYLYKEPTYLIDYFHFMDCLINTPEDVQLLAEKFIAPNWLGSNDVCQMFNTLSTNTRPSWSYAYAELSDDLSEHCSKKRNKWMTTLKSKYFAQPWAGISVIYAIVLLLLTIAQVVLAILDLRKKT